MSGDFAGMLRALREEFDRAFAAPPVAPPVQVALLAIRVGAEAAALRLRETAGLLPARKVVPVSSRRPELLGVAGLRGTILPVYGLARLLGVAEGSEPPRWIALAGAVEERIGLAFAGFDGHVVVAEEQLYAPAAGASAGRHVAAVAALSDGARPVLGVASILEAIMRHP